MAEPDLPPCHWLHYLQMASEEVAKAHALAERGANLSHATTSHVGVDAFARAFLLSPVYDADYEGKSQKRILDMRRVGRTAGEIERLAPAVDRDQTPRNVEYPWLGPRDVIAPCDHDFADLAPDTNRGLLTFMRLVKRAIDTYDPGS